jgi:hypothetical protein
LLALVPLGCSRGKDTPKGSSADKQAGHVEPTTPKPEYDFAAGLEAQYPEIVGFVRQFLETALAGDYAGYRKLVARVADPESRARFESVLNAMKSLSIEAIEELEMSPIPPPTYLVTARAELLPEKRVTLRRGSNSRVAILVLQEEGEWRMMLAPSELQPSAETTQPATAPATTAPSYPWQQDGDY